ncbi:NucA/NucB deoxyribonuclease domain-containing protein [Kingella negevensis]|uniref:NucA/NucB deoxyribonuclease domain-containing protein n=2 Tax=Kingella negevensis TaxID=1522312 RepID=UPI002542F15A|nr:NucA/NucB deoxyribonuclease domain-containing protein [Kingella negevensis]MDK4679970.1 NucA/NucB deoxyribonuclease domain-containing protein [Kingella negevensis]MDK4682311.1 NucA/NucB deoxyribonuclease domain-containing protein [Kingella negevensis]MDK4690508.1 NucA/NucB deoxyribonuclease domain-containing protein [Kingella negevensis]MDK4692144.1 NucA/NucB deoxyribonuclease domain-containing protein [Kingella negevensis]WII92308.1 NucA/NucB deoxyribonuclease domain-containing protein [Ki
MMKIIADTNLLVRVVLQDDEQQAAIAADYLRRASSIAISTITFEGYDCDEYPFASSYEGGSLNYKAGRVSLRAISATDNQSGGGLLGSMYRVGNISNGERFLVIANPNIPISFYLTKNGKNNL